MTAAVFAECDLVRQHVVHLNQEFKERSTLLVSILTELQQQHEDACMSALDSLTAFRDKTLRNIEALARDARGDRDVSDLLSSPPAPLSQVLASRGLPP